MNLKPESQQQFEFALMMLDGGDPDTFDSVLYNDPALATARDDGNATLLIRLVDWPGHRPNADELARLLLEYGAEVDARRDDDQGTPLAGAV